jgi:HEPN pEK499 p136
MAYYPKGHFIREFARRTLENIEAMRAGEKIEWPDTSLVSFLLAVFVLPHERSDEDRYMAELLKSYPPHWEKVVEIVRHKKLPVSASGQGDEPPSSLEELPRYLRNAVAHFNIRPESGDGQTLTHLLIWNKLIQGPNRGKINFVARVNVAELSILANHVLKQLAITNVADRYEDTDPIKAYDEHWKV